MCKRLTKKKGEAIFKRKIVRPDTEQSTISFSFIEVHTLLHVWCFFHFIFENASRESRSLGVALNFKNLRRCIHKQNQQWPSVNTELGNCFSALFSSRSRVPPPPVWIQCCLSSWTVRDQFRPVQSWLYILRQASFVYTSIILLNILDSIVLYRFHRFCNTTVSHWNWGTMFVSVNINKVSTAEKHSLRCWLALLLLNEVFRSILNGLNL